MGKKRELRINWVGKAKKKKSGVRTWWKWSGEEEKKKVCRRLVPRQKDKDAGFGTAYRKL